MFYTSIAKLRDVPLRNKFFHSVIIVSKKKSWTIIAHPVYLKSVLILTDTTKQNVLQHFTSVLDNSFDDSGQVPCGCDKPNPVRSGRKQRSVCSQRDAVSLTFFYASFLCLFAQPASFLPVFFVHLYCSVTIFDVHRACLAHFLHYEKRNSH